VTDAWRAWLDARGMNALPERPTCLRCNKPVDLVRDVDQHPDGAVTLDLRCHGEEMDFKVERDATLDSVVQALRRCFDARDAQ
jgi:hypothetical protein